MRYVVETVFGVLIGAVRLEKCAPSILTYDFLLLTATFLCSSHDLTLLLPFPGNCFLKNLISKSGSLISNLDCFGTEERELILFSCGFNF